jgi:hypothetical protein
VAVHLKLAAGAVPQHQICPKWFGSRDPAEMGTNEKPTNIELQDDVTAALKNTKHDEIAAR